MDGNAFQRSLIDDKRPKLREGPGVECCALRPSSLHPRANVREFFQRNRPLRAFGLRNNPFGETVVHVFGKATFLTGQLPQAAAAAEGTELLQLVPEPPMTIAHVRDCLAGIDFPIAIRGDVRDTQIDAKDAISLVQFWCFNFTRDEQIPRAGDEHQIALAALMREQRALPFATDERDCLSPVECPDRNQRIGKRKRENAVIVGNRAVWPERALFLVIQLVGIRDFGNTAHRHLRGKAERFAHALIGQLVHGKLAERARRKGNLTDKVAGGISRFNRASERVGLRWRRVQVQLDGELHLASLLLLNGGLDRFSRDVSGATDIVRTTPPRRQARTQVWNLIAQNTGGAALELIGTLRWRAWWRARHEQMQVIGHHVQRLDRAMQLGCLLMQPFVQAIRTCAGQHLAAVLRTPDDVGMDRRDAASHVAVSFSTHVLTYTILFDKRQLRNNVGGRASSARRKPAVSARTFL